MRTLISRGWGPASHRLLIPLILLLLFLPAASAGSPGETILVRLSPNAVVGGLSPDALPLVQQAGLHPWRILDYGSFAWLELPAAELDRLQATGLPHQVRTQPFALRLGEQSFDPLIEAAPLPTGWQSTARQGPDLHLVQMVGPLRAHWREHLESSELHVLRYVHPYTYIVWGEPGALQRAADADFVRWTGPFEPAYRVLPQWRSLGADPVQVDVLLVRAAGPEEVIGQLEALGGQLHGSAVLDEAFVLATLTLPGTAFQAAARIPGVYSIQVEPEEGGLRGEMSNQVCANNLDASNQAFPGYVSWLAGLGLDGLGVVIASVDAGMQDTHPDLIGRILPCTGQTCGGAASSQHGTHTAGIMAADGSSGFVDSRDFLRGLGMAPGAGLVEQVYTPWYQGPGGMLLLMAESQANGALISGNSWGPSRYPLGYDNDTMQVDIGVRDADQDTSGNRPLIYVLSIMNGNGGVSSQGTPDEAKNILAVGSTYMQYSDGRQQPALEDLSYNTAHGPALDGRKLPHLVAPGNYVDSTLPDGYGLMAGTSMASPHVSGAVALLVEDYRRRFASDPSPALVKAAFLPVARDLAGHHDADGGILGHPFDSKQGWGRLDAAAVLDPGVPVYYFDQDARFDDTGQIWQRELETWDNGQPVRLMLAWTDAPGHGAGGSTPAWCNDLDLELEVDGALYRGNGFGADGWSLPGTGADEMNNTEGILMPAGSLGRFTVRVVASHINSDGVPGVGDTTDQDFALVCYNCLVIRPWKWYLPLLDR